MSNKLIYGTTESVTGITGTTNSSTVTMTNAEKFSFQANITVAASTAKNFADSDVDTATDRVTITSHGYSTGRKGQLTTTGTLPAGLSTGVDYFIIRVDANTVKFATSLANAQAGTTVDITAAAGGGTHTFTPTALAGASVVLQKSNDGVNFINDASPTSVSATGSLMFEESPVPYHYARLQFTLTAGELSCDIYPFIQGDA